MDPAGRRRHKNTVSGRNDLAEAVCGGCSPASMHSGLRQNSSWLDFWETEAEQKGEELVECKVLCI